MYTMQKEVADYYENEGLSRESAEAESIHYCHWISEADADNWFGDSYEDGYYYGPKDEPYSIRYDDSLAVVDASDGGVWIRSL